ncbi:MAG: methionyl-tRNA formyltransferase [Gammaproteobacteria bacterium]|nr:methionyl-tRNA formyltransferase [Gammaproteobacteria bacterium]
MHPLKIIFAGTPSFAAEHLHAILDSSHRVVAVYTQPDRPSGRGKKRLPSPVKVVATKQGIPVKQPLSLKGESAQLEMTELDADLLVVVAYGLILPESILQVPRYGCINVHASLLPRWRGAAPIERAIIAGDKETGITIMQMDEGLDTGDMLLKRPVVIEKTDTRVSLQNKLVTKGTEALRTVLDDFFEFQSKAKSQDNALSTYASKVAKDEALISWDSEAMHICRQIRAGIGRNPAYSFIDKSRVRLLEGVVSSTELNGLPGTIAGLGNNGMTIICGRGSITITKIQMPGKNPVRVQDMLNSSQSLFTTGKRLTKSESAD